MRCWSAEEVRTFLHSTREEPYHALFFLALATGMRLGEILGLQWKDIDFDRRVIKVHVQLDERRELVQPKTLAGRRQIEIGDLCVAVLREHQKQQLQDGHRGSGFVFTTKTGTPLHHHNVTQRLFARAIAKAKVTKIRFHDLRHTFASMRLAGGDNLKLLSTALGHSDPALTLKTYSHVTDGQQREAADRHDKALSGTVSGGQEWRPISSWEQKIG